MHKMLKKIKSMIIIMILIFAFLVFPINLVSADNETFDKLSFSYEFNEIKLEKVTILETKFTRLSFEGCQWYSIEDMPRIPMEPLKILFPKGYSIDHIEININQSEIINLDDYPQIEKSLQSYSFDNDIGFIDISNQYYYEGKFPIEPYKYIGVQYFRGFPVLYLNIFPVQYNHDKNEILFNKKIDLDIHLSPESINPLYRAINKDKKILSNQIDNSNRDILKDYKDMNLMSSSLYDYVIITAKDFKNYHGIFDLHALVDAREKQGLSANIVTVEEIYDGYSGNDEPEKIRNFIKYAYTNWGTDYVLLAGDVEYVPIRNNLYSEHETGLTSDIYYMCLDGDYNFDHDNIYGEPRDGINGKWIDLYADVFVGRAPVDSGQQIENFVRKTLDYEKSNWNIDSYLKNVESVGQKVWDGIGGWGANYVEKCIDHCTDYGQNTLGIPSIKYDVKRLYEKDMEPDWTDQDIIDDINDGINILNHLGHGSINKNMKLTTDDIAELSNDKFGFWYSQGCHSGQIEASDECVAEAWVVYQGGGFATIQNSGDGFGSVDDYDGPSNRYCREFFDALNNAQEQISRLGVALADCRIDNLWHINETHNNMYHCCYTINLLGCPFVQIKGMEDLHADFTWNPEHPRTNVPITFFDRSGGDNERLWEFGDGKTSILKNPIHQYQVEGNYTVNLTIFGEIETETISKTIEIKEEWSPVIIINPEKYSGNNPVVKFDSTESYDPDGIIVSYYWDFDDGTNSYLQSPTHLFEIDKSYNVKLNCEDNRGNIAIKSCWIYIDVNVPPETQLVVDGNLGKNNWYKSKSTVSLIPNDWTGVNYTKYRINQGNWSFYESSFDLKESGYYYIDYYSEDIYNNTEEVKTTLVKIDNVLPSIQLISPTSGDNLNGDIKIEWYSQDNFNKPSINLYYRYENSNKWIEIAINIPNQGEYYWDSSNFYDGEYHLKIVAEDDAGNINSSECSVFNIRNGNNPPSIRIDIESPGFGGIYVSSKRIIPLPFGITIIFGSIDLEIDANINDPYLQIDHVELYLGDSLIMNFSHVPNIWSWNNPNFGRQIIKIVAYDNLGRYKTYQKTMLKYF